MVHKQQICLIIFEFCILVIFVIIKVLDQTILIQL